MLTTPDKLLLFHLLGDNIQNKLLHHLHSDGSEANLSTVSQILLALFLKTEVTLAFLQSFGISLILHYLSLIKDSVQAIPSASFLSIPGCIQLGPVDLCVKFT